MYGFVRLTGKNIRSEVCGPFPDDCYPGSEGTCGPDCSPAGGCAPDCGPWDVDCGPKVDF